MVDAVPVINSISIDLDLRRPGDKSVEKLTQGFIKFHLDLMDLFSKKFAKMNDIIPYIIFSCDCLQNDARI